MNNEMFIEEFKIKIWLNFALHSLFLIITAFFKVAKISSIALFFNETLSRIFINVKGKLYPNEKYSISVDWSCQFWSSEVAESLGFYLPFSSFVSNNLNRKKEHFSTKKEHTVYGKESFSSQESDTMTLSEYVCRLLGRHYQLSEVHEV